MFQRILVQWMDHTVPFLRLHASLAPLVDCSLLHQVSLVLHGSVDPEELAHFIEGPQEQIKEHPGPQHHAISWHRIEHAESILLFRDTHPATPLCL